MAKVEGKTPEQTEVLRGRVLEKILGGRSRFVDPVSMGVAIKRVDSV